MIPCHDRLDLRSHQFLEHKELLAYPMLTFQDTAVKPLPNGMSQRSANRMTNMTNMIQSYSTQFGANL
jgi:hypothetical protein